MPIPLTDMKQSRSNTMKAATEKKFTKQRKTAITTVPAPESKPEADAIAPRVVKRGTCMTLNGKGELEFLIGVDSRGEVQLRVVENSGTGSFNDDWVRFKDIQGALDRAPKGTPVTSFLLNPLFRGVSQNTVGFIWAVLVKEGIVVPSTTTKRRYDRVEPTAFLAHVRDLMEGRTANAVGEKKSQKPVAAKAGSSKPKKSNKATKT
jgi:hypothetical protein